MVDTLARRGNVWKSTPVFLLKGPKKGLQPTPTQPCLLIPSSKMPWPLGSLKSWQAMRTRVQECLEGPLGCPLMRHEVWGTVVHAMFHIPSVKDDFSFYLFGE